MSTRIARVRSITIEGVRGFVRPQHIDTDADIVLLAGPNGFGKTSLIDAVSAGLTGIRDDRREPFVCTLPKEGSARRGRLEIVAAVSGGSNAEFVLDIPENPRDVLPAVNSDAPWGSHTAEERRVATRASFFFQDELERLFDEENPLILLESYLVGSRVSADQVQLAIKEGLKHLRNKKAAIRPSGYSQAQQPESKRVDFAWQLEDAWQRAAQALESDGTEVPPLNGLLKESGAGLSPGWKKKLAECASRCVAQSGGKMEGPAGSDPVSALQVIRRFWEDKREAFLASVAHRADEQELTNLLEAIADETVLVSERGLGAKEQELDGLHRREEELIQRLSSMQALERHFADHSESGVDLRDVMKSLRVNGPAWSSPPECPDPSIRPPEEVVKWVRSAASSLDAEGAPADEALNDWLARIASVRARLTDEKYNLSEEIRSVSSLISRSRSLLDIGRKVPALGEVLSRMTAEGREAVSVRQISEVVPVASARTPSAVTPIEALLAITAEWIKCEQEVARVDQALKADARYQAVKAAVDHLEKATNFESSEKGVLSNLGIVPEEDRKRFGRYVSYVLGHLNPVEGVLPLEFSVETKSPRDKDNRPWRVRTDDGRGYSSLSYGQRVQVAVSMVVALNAALRRRLWFDVMAFDDFTSALDMTNLPRVTALMRRIAYGDSHDGQSEGGVFRRQLFIASHHEDMTNRLLDFLVPPAGRRLRLVRFTGWKSNNGPVIDQVDVRPGASASNERDRLGRLITSRLKQETVWGRTALA